MSLAPFLEESGDSLICVWDEVRILVQGSYFDDPPIAQDLGGVIETLAFVDLEGVKTAGGTSVPYALRLPALLRFNYVTEESPRTSIDPSDESEVVTRVFLATKGMKLVDSVQIIQSSDNVSALFRILSASRITGVSYTDMARMFIDGAKLNAVSPGVLRSVLEAMTSHMARTQENMRQPFRFALASGKATEDSAVFARLKELPRLGSVFTGLGFEDIQMAVQTGVTMSMTNAEQDISPMEGIMKL